MTEGIGFIEVGDMAIRNVDGRLASGLIKYLLIGALVAVFLFDTSGIHNG